jgi:D-galactarolactone cycloisomerase
VNENVKIERIETYPLLYQLDKPYGDANGLKKYRSCFLIHIITESGYEGWGECVDWLPTLVKGFEERIKPFLLGKNATKRLPLVRTLTKWHQRIASAVSMALTEIMAQASGVSVCNLWGGAFRNVIPVYASFQSYREDENWIMRSIKDIENAVMSGFRQCKVKIGGKPFKEDVEHIRRIQDLYGELIELAVDANQSYDFRAAGRWEAVFRDWNNFLWMEEPMPLDRVEDYCLLRSSLSIPVAGGENLLDGKQFLPLLSSGSLDIIQPDVSHQEGIDGFRETLQLGRLFGKRVSAHAFDGPLSRLYAIFAQAMLPQWSKMDGEEIEPIEWDVMENPLSRVLPLQPINGSVKLPEGIGIGMQLDREVIKAYLWDGSIYI